jgi:VanZ family protein
MGEPWPGVRTAVWYAALLEAGQFFVPGRYPDVTDIMITSAAAGLVAVLVERADRNARRAEPESDPGLNARGRAGRF